MIRGSGKFDLFYYDELANQTEEIKLSIEGPRDEPPQKEDLEPPINGKMERPFLVSYSTFLFFGFVFFLFLALVSLNVAFCRVRANQVEECHRRLERRRAHSMNCYDKCRLLVKQLLQGFYHCQAALAAAWRAPATARLCTFRPPLVTGARERGPAGTARPEPQNP